MTVRLPMNTQRERDTNENPHQMAHLMKHLQNRGMYLRGRAWVVCFTCEGVSYRAGLTQEEHFLRYICFGRDKMGVFCHEDNC